jgi:hypothetical protein
MDLNFLGMIDAHIFKGKWYIRVVGRRRNQNIAPKCIAFITFFQNFKYLEHTHYFPWRKE